LRGSIAGSSSSPGRRRRRRAGGRRSPAPASRSSCSRCSCRCSPPPTPPSPTCSASSCRATRSTFPPPASPSGSAWSPPAAVCYGRVARPPSSRRRRRARGSAPPSRACRIALVVLFAAFVTLQLTALYGGHDYVLRTAGLTYAEYAREGFAQLLAAAALTLAVIAAAARWARVSRLLLGALCALTLVVLASALTRLDLYMDAYGFTRLRLSAQAAILWLGGVFALVLIAGAARRMGWLPRATVALTAAAILGFAISNPDHRIAEHNVKRSGRVDERVLRGLSADAAPALPCRLRSEVEPDGLLGFNLGRSQARSAPC
jgi:hypothetical protein